MAADESKHNTEPGESEESDRTQEIDDQFRSLMEGLRTTIPGVMVLFSFLLILPLQSSFAEISTSNRIVFYTAFGSAALSSILLISPSVHQRVRAPISGIRRRTMNHVMKATKLAIAGTILFAIAISAVVFLVSSLVFSDPPAIIATSTVALIAAWSWFYLPLVNFEKHDDRTG